MKRFFAYVVLFFGFLFCSLSQALDSLERLLEQKEGTDRISLLLQMSRSTWLNYPSKALQYGEAALDLSIEFKDSANISQSLRHIGATHYYEGEYDSSMKYNSKALEIALAIKDSSLINNGYNNVGLLNYNLGNYESALEFFFRSRRIKESIKESYGLPTVVNNIGLVYEAIEDYESARTHFNEAYQLAVETNDVRRIIYTQNNLGITYNKENKLAIARDYFDKAWVIAKEENNIVYGAVSMRGIGEILFKKGDLDSAMVYYQGSLEESDRIKDRRGVSETYYLMGQLEASRGNRKVALGYLDKSSEIAEDLKVRRQLLYNLTLYASIYGDMDNPRLENSYLSQYIMLRDSLYQGVVEHNLTHIPIKIKEEDDRRKFAEQQAELLRKSSINRMYVVIIFLAAALMIFLIVLIRNNRKANRILKESNEELKSTQKLLVTSEKMASLGVLTAGIGHEINNPLNFIKNGSEALSKKLEEKHGHAEEFTPFIDVIQEGVKRASDVVKSMSQFSRGGVDMNEQCDVHSIIDNCLVILNNKISIKADVIKNYMDNVPIVVGNEGKLHQAFLNILSNAEHAIESKGTITIGSSANSNKITLSFRDTGMGIPEEHLVKISDPFFTTKAPGEGLGLGLFITYSIIEEHQGSIHISSNENGTEIAIDLPIK